MDRMRVLGRLLVMHSRVDAIVAVALGFLLLVWASPYRPMAPRAIYRWASGVGLALSLSWWGLLLCELCNHESPDNAMSFMAYLVVPAGILGAEAGVAGFIALPKPWNVGSMVLGTACTLPALALAVVMMRARLFH